MTPHLTTHSTGARDSMAFIILPCDKVERFRPRPVNSGVRCLHHGEKVCLNLNPLADGVRYAGNRCNFYKSLTLPKLLMFIAELSIGILMKD